MNCCPDSRSFDCKLDSDQAGDTYDPSLHNLLKDGEES